MSWKNVPAGMLPQIGAGLHVSAAIAGQFVNALCAGFGPGGDSRHCLDTAMEPAPSVSVRACWAPDLQHHHGPVRQPGADSRGTICGGYGGRGRLGAGGGICTPPRPGVPSGTRQGDRQPRPAHRPGTGRAAGRVAGRATGLATGVLDHFGARAAAARLGAMQSA